VTTLCLCELHQAGTGSGVADCGKTNVSELTVPSLALARINLRTLGLDNDDVVGDELPDGASRVGIGDNASMERIDEDSASADAGDLGGELLYKREMHIALIWSARSFS
jgi:hypothetical protein